MAKRLNKGLVGGLVATLAMALITMGAVFIMNLPGQDPQVHAQAADELIKKGEYESAMLMYQRAYLKRGDNPAGPYLLKAAEAALEVPKREAIGFAITFLDTAINKDPKFDEAHRMMVSVRKELAQKIGPQNVAYWQELLDATKKAIEFIPEFKDDPEILFAQALAYQNLQSNDAENKQRALDALRKAHEIDPSNTEVVEQLAISLYTEAQRKERDREYATADADKATVRQLLASTAKKAADAGDREGAARLQLMSARIDLFEGNAEKCIAAAQKVAQGDAMQATAYLFLGELFLSGRNRGIEMDLDRSEEMLKKGLEIEPDNGPLYIALGTVYQQRQRTAKNLKERLEWHDRESELYESGLDKITFTDNFRDQGKFFAKISIIQKLCQEAITRAAYLTDKAQRDQAITAAQASIDLLTEEVPDKHPLVLSLKAAVENARGNVVAAIKEGEAALKAYGNQADIQLYSLMGDLYARRGALGLAEEMIKKALQLQTNPGLYRTMGLILVQQSRFTEALRFLKPDSPPELREILLNDPVATQLRIEIYTQLDQPELAQAEADRLGEAPATELVNIRLLAENGKCDEAIAAARSLYEADVANERNLDFFINMYMRCERRSEGYAYFSDLAAQDSTNAVLQRAVILLQEDSESRVAAITDWLKENREGIDREIALANHYRANGMVAEEAAALSAAEQIDPKNPNVLDMQFTYCMREQEWDRAEKYADLIAETDMDGSGGLISRGRLYVAKAEHHRNEKEMDACKETAATAIELLRQGLDEYPNNSMGWTFLAQCYLFQNDIGQAKQALERSIDINPNNGLAAKIRARLAYIEDDQPTFRRFLAKAARSLPTDEWVNQMSLVAREQENPGEAISSREQRRKDAPDDVENLIMLARLYKDPDVAQFRDAEQVYRDALAKDGSNLSLVREVANFFASDSVNLPQEGEQLLKDRLQSEKTLESKAQIAMILGDFYASQDRYTTAERHYQMAISFDDSPKMIGAAADFYRRSRRYDKALELYNRIIDGQDQADGAVTDSELNMAMKQRVAILLTLQRYDQAKGAIDTFVAKFPKDDDGIVFEGAYHLYGGNIDKALEAFDRHLRADPENATALWQRGRLFLLQGDYRKAIEDLKLSKAERPDGFEYRHRILLAEALLAESLRRNEAGTEAALELQEIIKDHPEQESVAQALVDIYTRMRPPQYEAAESLVYRYMQQNPGNYQWPMLLGEFGHLSGDINKKLQGFQRAAEVSNYAADALNKYFRALREAGQCEVLIDTALSKVPNERLERSAAALSALAYCYGKSGDVEKAVATFTRAQAIAGNNFDAYNAILQDLIETLGLEAGLAQMEKVVAGEPSNLVARRALVHLKFVSGDINGALETCETIIQQTVRDGDRLFANIAKGMLYDDQEKYTEARDAYEAALKIDDSHPLALNNISYLLSERLNQPSEALPYARRAAKARPNDAGILDTYGWILAQTDQLGEASGTLLRAIEIDKDNIDAMFHLGLVHEMRGEKEKAIKRLEQARDFIDQYPEKDGPMRKRLEGYRSKIEETLSRLT